MHFLKKIQVIKENFAFVFKNLEGIVTYATVCLTVTWNLRHEMVSAEKEKNDGNECFYFLLKWFWEIYEGSKTEANLANLMDQMLEKFEYLACDCFKPLCMKWGINLWLFKKRKMIMDMAIFSLKFLFPTKIIKQAIKITFFHGYKVVADSAAWKLLNFKRFEI